MQPSGESTSELKVCKELSQRQGQQDPLDRVSQHWKPSLRSVSPNAIHLLQDGSYEWLIGAVDGHRPPQGGGPVLPVPSHRSKLSRISVELDNRLPVYTVRRGTWLFLLSHTY